MGEGVTNADQSEVVPGTVAPPRFAAGPYRAPHALTSFVGREHELAELDDALAGTRLLTLTGPGGCGKTRLALRLAARVLERFPDGVWWVELAPLRDERLVGPAIAEALGVRPLPGMTDLQAACAYLASRRALIILDNCEHLVDACANTAEAVLQAAAGAVVLATSRAPLGAAGEADWRVPPMSLPVAGMGGRAGTPAGSDAVSLFVERAGKVNRGFALTTANADSVTTVCARLDGLPLAIELAAARVRSLSVEQIADGIADRFRLVAGGPRTASPRQQTLRASVDWSHDLLTADEQILLRRLAVFAGGFTLDAAEKACAWDGVEPDQVLDLLASLVDQSLVIADERSAAARYRLLETVREYGIERLVAAGEHDAAHARHRDIFVALAEAAAPHLGTRRQAHWFEQLDAEAANLAAAIDEALRTVPRVALRLCGALWLWWANRNRFAEASLACSRALAACDADEPELRARALHGQAFLALRSGDPRGEEYAREALALADEAADRSTAARARCQLAAALMFTNPGPMRAELARAAALARAAGDEWALAVAQQLTANSYVVQSRHAEAIVAYEASAPLAEQVGDAMLMTWRWLFAAMMATDDGHFHDVRKAVDRRRAIADASQELVGDILAEVALALVEILEGTPERPLERLPGQMERALTMGAGMAVPALLFATGLAEVATGRLEEGRARLEGLLPLIENRDRRTASWVLCVLSEARRVQGEHENAEATALRAQAVGEQLGNRLLATRGRLTLGRLAAARGDLTAARQHAFAHLDACAEGGHASYVPECLDALAEVAAGLREHRDAVRLFAAAERARADIGVVRILPEAPHWDAIDHALGTALGAEAYAAARDEGASLSVEDALAWARRARGPRGRPPGGWASLTPTEANVAALVGEGLTNAQVGARMFVSPETVKTHLSHIFRKLGVHNRGELIAHAARRSR